MPNRIPENWSTLSEKPEWMHVEMWRKIQVGQEILQLGERPERRCTHCRNSYRTPKYECFHVPYGAALRYLVRTWKCLCCHMKGIRCSFQTGEFSSLVP